MLRKGALVLWRGQVVPIVGRFVGPDAVSYCIHTRGHDRALIIDYQVSIGQLMAELDRHAKWCLGDKVEMRGFATYVKARWWNARTGQVMYRLNDQYDEGRARRVVDQETLLARVLAEEQTP